MKRRKKSVFFILLSCVLVILAHIVALDMFPKFWQGNGFYLRFLKEHSDKEWHTMWQQLWDLSDSVTVPRSIVDYYGGDVEAADKIIELIASYAFWVDDNGTDGQYSFRSDRLELTVYGVRYFSNAVEMQEQVDSSLQNVFDSVNHGSQLEIAENIDDFLCGNVVYGDEGSMQGQTLYSTLIERRALCGGFARTFNVLALMAGIDSRITVGYLTWSDGVLIRHAWNTYTIDGVDYFADTTVNTTSFSNWAINRVIDESYDINYLDSETHAEAVNLKYSIAWVVTCVSLSTKQIIAISLIAVAVVSLLSFTLGRLSVSKAVNSPASIPESAQYIGYLSFLKENSPKEWHTVWEQLWSNSWTVRIPASISKKYESTQEAADKILEHIRAYVFWVDLPVDAQISFSRTAMGELELTGFVYYVNSDEVILSVDKALSGALDGILKVSDPYDRVVLIDRYLRQNVVYSDKEPQEGQTIHSALVNNKAVCAGYAYAFNVLALLSDLDSRIVTGYTSVRQKGGEYLVVRHAWNVVRIDGVDYMTDTTTNTTSRTRRVVNQKMSTMDTDFYIAVEGDYAKEIRKSVE